MAKDGFARAYARVRVYEGGNVDDPRDPGGRTSRGVTQRVYTAWLRRQGRPATDVWRAPDADVAEVYRTLYWQRCACDELPAGIDFVVFNAAVNSGTGQAGRWLQRSVPGYAGAIDGSISAVTLTAVAEDEDNDRLIGRFCSAQLGTLHGLKTWRVYGKGWGARIANVEKIGQAWASGSIGPDPIAVDHLGGHRKAPVAADTIRRPLLDTATATVAASATAVATPAAELGQQLEVMRDWFSWMPFVLGGLAVIAGIAAWIVKYGHASADKVAAGCATAEVDPTADEAGTPVPVNDNAWQPLAAHDDPDPSGGPVAAPAAEAA